MRLQTKCVDTIVHLHTSGAAGGKGISQVGTEAHDLAVAIAGKAHHIDYLLGGELGVVAVNSALNRVSPRMVIQSEFAAWQVQLHQTDLSSQHSK